ncbi:MAG: ATP-binding cassette domain-containing protein [Caldilineaceae bacterium]|nr:ATP-binding cassette domain-containing protein [Caldilineaceae bacterium]
MIELSGVTKRYGPNTVVDSVSLTVPGGGVTALVGPNGAGKSSLLSMIGRLLPMDEGEIRVDGLDVSRTAGDVLAKKLSILRQENQVAVRLTVKELVEFGRFPHSRGRLTAEDGRHVEEAIDFLELAEFSGRPIDRLSGGQRQRAFIAMVLCQDTDYVLLDEPLNNLDMRHASQTMGLIRRLATELSKTIVIVLHDINFASYHADRVVAMKDGAIVADGTPREIITGPSMAEIFDLEVPVHSYADRPVAAYFAIGSRCLHGQD